jgi:adenylate cyclase
MQPGVDAQHPFLFADLVGFTALADAEGDDRAAEVALALHNGVREILPAFGAEEVKALGDGIMIRCEDPAAAIQLGLRIVQALEANPAVPAVRVGIHSGTAVGHDGDWYGRAVNVASETSTSPPGATEPIPTFSARRRDCAIAHRFREMVARDVPKTRMGVAA